jgi:hypothetical protein
MKKPGFAGSVAGLLLALATQNALGQGLKSIIGTFDPAHAETGLSIGVVACMLGGAACFCGVRRALLGASAAFWQSTLGRWLIGRMAGAAVILLLLEPVLFVVRFCVNQALMGAYHAGGLELTAVMARLYWPCAWALTAAMIWRLRTPAKELIGKGSKPLLRLYRSWFMRRGGSSAFSNLLDEWANRWKPGMILLGASMFDRHWRVGIKDDRHMLTISSPGGGKGRSAILPNLITYPGSVLCLDVKGQNAAVSARARQKRLNQKVHIVAPMGAPEGLEDMVARFNPLAELYPESPDYAEQVDLIADALVIPGGDKSQFWDENARTVIAGLIDYVVRASLEEEWDPDAPRLENHSREEAL